MPQDKRYDVQLSYGSTDIPLMLVTDPNTKLKKFLSYYAPPLGQSIQTGEASEANFPPEQELVISQNEFHGGMGWLNAFRNIGNKVYAYSNGVDARARGKVKLAPKENTATITVTHSSLGTSAFDNMDFESWTDDTTLDAWQKTGGCTTNRSTTIPTGGGTYSCNLVPAQTSDGWDSEDETFAAWTAGAGSKNTTSTSPHNGNYSLYLFGANPSWVYQDVTWDNNYKGKSFTFTAWLKSTVANSGYISIDDGVGATKSSYVAGDDTWHQISVARTLDANATRLRLIFGAENTSGLTFLDGIFTLTNYAVSCSLYQDMIGWTDYYTYTETPTFTLKVKTGIASNIRLGIYDGNSTQYGDYHTGGGNWETLSVSPTIVANATGLRIIIERNSTTYAATDYIDVGTFSLTRTERGAPLAPQSFILYKGTYYYLENKTVYALSGTTFTEVYTLQNVITGAEVFGDNLIVAVGTGDYYSYFDGTTWTKTSTASYKMLKLCAIGETLYGQDSLYSLKTATDPISGSWSSAIKFGTSASDITSFCEYLETIFVGKKDNLYYLDTSGNPHPMAPDFKGLFSPYNCLGMQTWQGILWLPTSKGIYDYDYSHYPSLLNVSPAVYMSAFTDYHGRVHAIVGDMNWLYLATSSSTATSSKTPLLACRYETIAGTEVEDDIRYHSLSNIDLDDVYSLGIYADKLWVSGLKSSAPYIRYFSLADDDYPTSGTFTFVTSYYDSNFPSFYKSYHSFELQSQNLAAGVTVKVEWQIDNGSWTELGGTGQGTFTSSAVANSVKYFQTSTYGKKIRFRFTLSTNSATVSPVILGFVVRGALRPDTLRVQEWWIDCSDDVVSNGFPTHGLASKIKSDLETAKAQTWALTIYDPFGSTWYGFIKSPTPEIQGYESIPGTGLDKRQKAVIHLVLQEAKLT